MGLGPVEDPGDAGAELVAFSRHALWVVAHGGRSLTCLEPPE